MAVAFKTAESPAHNFTESGKGKAVGEPSVIVTEPEPMQPFKSVIVTLNVPIVVVVKAAVVSPFDH